MMIDDVSFTLLASSSTWDRKFSPFQVSECHWNWALKLGDRTLCLDASKKFSTLYVQRSCCLNFRDCLSFDYDDPWVSCYNTLWEMSKTWSVPFLHGVKLWMHSLHWKVEYQLKWLPSVFFFLLQGFSIAKAFWYWLSRLQGGARNWKIEAHGQCFYKCGRQLWLDDWCHEHGLALAVERQVSLSLPLHCSSSFWLSEI